MPVRLFEHPDHPNRVALSETGMFASDSIFFLDFSRPLEYRYCYGIKNPWLGLGFPFSLLVPIVHQGQNEEGGFIVPVFRGEPEFAEIRRLWRLYYAEKRITPTTPVDGLRIIGDFATQFPSSAGGRMRFSRNLWTDRSALSREVEGSNAPQYRVPTPFPPFTPT